MFTAECGLRDTGIRASDFAKQGHLMKSEICGELFLKMSTYLQDRESSRVIKILFFIDFMLTTEFSHSLLKGTYVYYTQSILRHSGFRRERIFSALEPDKVWSNSLHLVSYCNWCHKVNFNNSFTPIPGVINM